MALNSKHPAFTAYAPDWETMRDVYEGERAVKAKGVQYLPATAAQRLDGQGKPNTDGELDYQAYKARAVLPEYVSEAVQEFIGLLHKKPAVFELPAAMQPMLERASVEGEGLLGLLRRINTEQLVPGRLGLMLDLPKGGGDLPYIALYTAEAIPNWDDSDDKQGINRLQLCVLNESGMKRNGLEWTEDIKYRVLQLVPLDQLRAQAPEVASVITAKPDNASDDVLVYVQGVFTDINSGGENNLQNYTAPVYRGVPLTDLPFVFINSMDTTAAPDKPPLMALGRLCLTIYRGEADYRHTLFMQGQETLVTIGTISNKDRTNDKDGEGLRVGAGAHIGVDIGGDAKYIGVSASGLSELRSSLENDRKTAESLAGKLISPSAGKQESGEALTTRLSAQTASLLQIATTGAAALESLLKQAAVWMGLNPDEVKVTPNLEFADTRFVPKDLLDTMSARSQGAPLSLKTIHANLKKLGVTEMDYEEEIEAIAEEDAETALRAAAKMATQAAALAKAGLPVPGQPAQRQPGQPAPGNGPAPAPGGPPAPAPAGR